MEDRWIKECLRQAKRAFDAGEVPVGAVVVKDGKVIAKAHNRVESLRDPTAHAELLAIKKALKKLNQNIFMVALCMFLWSRVLCVLTHWF